MAMLKEVTEVMGNSLGGGCGRRLQRGSDDSACVGVSQGKCESEYEYEEECCGRGTTWVTFQKEEKCGTIEEVEIMSGDLEGVSQD